MQYQTIVDLIRSTAIAALEAVKPVDGIRGSAFHCRNAEYTMTNDSPFPHINFQIISDKQVSDNGTRAFQLSFLFNEQQSEGYTEAETEAIRERMAVLSNQFFMRLDAADSVLLGFGDNVEVNQQFQARATGYATNCTITGHFASGDICTELP